MPIDDQTILPARRCRLRGPILIALGMLLSLAASPAQSDLVVSQLIVEFKPGASRTADVEVLNNADERAYALVEPREILHPGTAGEQPHITPDPAKLGLIVSPARFILEPRQRRTLRIAAIGASTDRERVYRVTVKPVTGEVAGSESGLKLLVGYDLLVLVRPSAITEQLKVGRQGSELSIVNLGNASVELAEGRQCEADKRNCKPLPSKRLYAGASWKQSLPAQGSGEYRVRTAAGWSTITF